jgi:hypothetical protein
VGKGAALESCRVGKIACAPCPRDGDIDKRFCPPYSRLLLGAKRTCMGVLLSPRRSQLTQLGHERPAFAAMHGPDLLYSVIPALGYAP